MLGDAYEPPLPEAAYDVVLCRHVLWAMPDPAVALKRWLRLLVPEGTLLLVEGRWSDDAGLSAEETVALVESNGRGSALTRLTDPEYWGRRVDDERYVVTSSAGSRA
jgi:SAM-dependent methyltransferase